MVYSMTVCCKRNCKLRSLVASALLNLLYSGQSTANMLVIQSNTPRYKVGEVLQDDDPVDLLGPGCRITVLKRPPNGRPNETAIIEGSKVYKPPIGGSREVPNIPCGF